MTYQIFHDDSYRNSFNAMVSGLDDLNHGLILDQTVFYPGGGGQPSDQGWLIISGNETKLRKVKKISGEIVHILPDEVSLPQVGSPLEGKLDWDHRYQLMRTHTAMHVLCGTIFRDYGASVTGGNMEPLRGRMDFEISSLIIDTASQLLECIEQS